MASASEESEEPPDYSEWTLDELKQEVDALSSKRDDLQGQSDDLVLRIADAENTITLVQRRIDALQNVAEQAVRERYKVQRQYSSLFEALLYADSLETFIDGVEYIKAASEVSIEELINTRADLVERERQLEGLVAEKASVDGKVANVSSHLEVATSARDEAQRKADLVNNAHLVEDGADWSAGEEKFVAAWAPRIDAYLAGSPLAGQGKAFAKAAWDNHIDPRYSPAISNTESSKGRYCIRPHNAWGWGAADSNPYGLASEWSSWEQAINAHVKGLAAGYGYTITPEGAQKYCPPSWEEWYANTVAQMNSI